MGKKINFQLCQLTTSLTGAKSLSICLKEPLQPRCCGQFVIPGAAAISHRRPGPGNKLIWVSASLGQNFLRGPQYPHISQFGILESNSLLSILSSSPLGSVGKCEASESQNMRWICTAGERIRYQLSSPVHPVFERIIKILAKARKWRAQLTKSLVTWSGIRREECE